MITKEQSQTNFEFKLNSLITEIKKKARSQFDYNWSTNVEKRLVKEEDCAEHAIINGTVHAISAYNHWDTDNAVLFAHHILEDSNAHTEAKALVPFIPEYQ